MSTFASSSAYLLTPQWSEVEDIRLLSFLGDQDEDTLDWLHVASNAFPAGHFSPSQCRERYALLSAQLEIPARGKWSIFEDHKLHKSVRKFGTRRWPEVSREIKSRNSKQCRERWQNQLDGGINHDPFTPEEDAMILELRKELKGNKWAEMANRMEKRPANAIKNRFNTQLKRFAEPINNQPATQIVRTRRKTKVKKDDKKTKMEKKDRKKPSRVSSNSFSSASSLASSSSSVSASSSSSSDPLSSSSSLSSSSLSSLPSSSSSYFSSLSPSRSSYTSTTSILPHPKPKPKPATGSELWSAPEPISTSTFSSSLPPHSSSSSMVPTYSYPSSSEPSSSLPSDGNGGGGEAFTNGFPGAHGAETGTGTRMENGSNIGTEFNELGVGVGAPIGPGVATAATGAGFSNDNLQYQWPSMMSVVGNIPLELPTPNFFFPPPPLPSFVHHHDPSHYNSMPTFQPQLSSWDWDGYPWIDIPNTSMPDQSYQS